MLVERDRKILELMAAFNGKTYIQALEKTAYLGKSNALKQASNRIRKIRDNFGLVKLEPTGLMRPKNVVLLTTPGKEYVDLEFGVSVGQTHISMVTIHHNILEMITWFWLNELGFEPLRATVKDWVSEKKHFHAPDIFVENFNGEKTYFEIETSKKSVTRYRDILLKIKKDGIKQVVYVFENDKKLRQIADTLPVGGETKIFFTTIDDLVKTASKGQINLTSQRDYLKNK